jgi:putative peptide zinc metalloprotease protein
VNTQIKNSDLSLIADTTVKFEICDNKDYVNKKILILHFESNTKYLVVDEITLYIIERLNCQKTFNVIFDGLRLKFNSSESIIELFEAFKSTITYTYLFDFDDKLINTKKDKYIYPKINLVSSDKVRKVSSLFTFLFGRFTFRILFIAIPVLLLILFDLNHVGFMKLYDYVDLNTAFVFYVGYIFCVLIHEFGHAAATRHFGASPNQIGFGFYLISPVFFCDVSDIWRLNRRERLIVDLGGIYFQWIISVLLIILYYITSNQFFIIFSFFNFISSLMNLNPFLLFDGYWALSDILGITNLREKSIKEFKKFFLSLIRFKWSISNYKELLIVSYASISFGMILIFFYYMIFVNTDSVLHFFYHLFVFYKKIIFEFNDVTFSYIKATLTSFIAPMIFYWLVFKLTKNKIKKWKNRL